jgi:hypothetical protein
LRKKPRFDSVLSTRRPGKISEALTVKKAQSSNIYA